MKKVNDVLWLSNGRFLYSVAEAGSFFGSACNFWEMRSMRVRACRSKNQGGSRIGLGFCMSGMSETADGKRLAFLKWAGEGNFVCGRVDGRWDAYSQSKAFSFE